LSPPSIRCWFLNIDQKDTTLFMSLKNSATINIMRGMKQSNTWLYLWMDRLCSLVQEKQQID
jgi:hypothetical protein